MVKLKYIPIILFTALISACSTTKFLAPGQKLYTGGEVKIADKENTTKGEAKALSTELTALLRPVPTQPYWVYAINYGYMIKPAPTNAADSGTI
jgi:hypothetical protein